MDDKFTRLLDALLYEDNEDTFECARCGEGAYDENFCCHFGSTDPTHREYRDYFELIMPIKQVRYQPIDHFDKWIKYMTGDEKYIKKTLSDSDFKLLKSTIEKVDSDDLMVIRKYLKQNKLQLFYPFIPYI